MTSIENFKSGMGSGLRKFFEDYESSIKELINNLDSDGLLLRNFSEEQVTRLQNITKSCNMALKLSKDFGSVFNPSNKKETEEKLECLKKAFNTGDTFRLGEHYHSILVNTYLTFLEKLKIYFLFFIDWKKLKKNHEDIHGIGNAIYFLKQKYSTNKYLNYFDSGTRNSLAHYTFFWEHGRGGKLNLCSDIFDTYPEEMHLAKFMMEINELNVLTEGFYILLADKFGLPEITLERMEK